MNGVHDMGGMHGFGKVEPDADERPFHAAWEARVLAMQRAIRAVGHCDFSTEEYVRAFTDLAGDALGILDALNIERAHIVCRSMSGGIGLIIGVDHPDRVESLTFVSTSTGEDVSIGTADRERRPSGLPILGGKQLCSLRQPPARAVHVRAVRCESDGRRLQFGHDQ